MISLKKTLLASLSFTLFLGCSHTEVETERSLAGADELVYIGDSQAVLWLGPVIGEYFSNIHKTCRASGRPLSALSPMSTFGFATGSSAFKHWTARRGVNHDHMCGNKNHSALIQGSEKYKGLRWNKNAPALCSSRTPLDGVFRIHPSPGFVVVNMLGNAAWDGRRVNGTKVIGSANYQFDLSGKYRNMNFDLKGQVREFLAKIPRGVPCLVLTTTPNKLERSVQMQRIHAQAVIESEVLNSRRCSFVRGITPEIDQTFARNSNFHGDKFHVSTRGANWWLQQKTPEICNAMNTAVQLVR